MKGVCEMSNSSLVTYTNISPSRNSPRNHKIDTITIHCMAGQMTTKNCVDMFAKKANRVSANYCIGVDCGVGLSCPEADRSWCSSSVDNDHRAITIEVACEPNAPYKVNADVYNKLLDLLTDVCKRNGIEKLVWSTDKNTRVNHLNGCNMTVHRDYANKACPGEYLYNKMSEIASTVNARLNPVVDDFSTDIWVVQTGAFHSKTLAENYANELKKKGIACIVKLKYDENNDGKVTVEDSRVVLNKSIGKE